MPTDRSFGENVDMISWLESRIDMQGSGRDELIDPALRLLLPTEESAAFQVLQIAMKCTKTAPMERSSSCKLVIFSSISSLIGCTK